MHISTTTSLSARIHTVRIRQVVIEISKCAKKIILVKLKRKNSNFNLIFFSIHFNIFKLVDLPLEAGVRGEMNIG